MMLMIEQRWRAPWPVFCDANATANVSANGDRRTGRMRSRQREVHATDSAQSGSTEIANAATHTTAADHRSAAKAAHEDGWWRQ